jgi:hypothetical protein
MSRVPRDREQVRAAVEPEHAPEREVLAVARTRVKAERTRGLCSEEGSDDRPRLLRGVLAMVKRR